MANDNDRTVTRHSHGPSGGWGSMKGIAKVAGRERPSPGTLLTLAQQNKAKGHMCTGCAWGKPADPHPAEFCENGAKATMWELTRDRCTPEFFAAHTLAELRDWADYDLEMEGRLTHPLRYDPASDRYLPVDWETAFTEIGSRLRDIAPTAAVFYASGRASLETSYLWALYARMYGHNNLPDSSNMCHETTSVGLKKVIGSPVGTCTLDDFEHCDAIFYFGQNPGTNSPRFLHPLQEAVKRGCKIITFNPVREQGLVSFVNPQNPLQMTVTPATRLSHQYLQVRPGGDIAAVMGMIKHILMREARDGGIIDHTFIAGHTHDFDALKVSAEAAEWSAIERNSGLTRAALEAAADVYCAAEKVICVYGMGITQHVRGAESIGMLANLLLLRGNIGRQGAGMSPVRGHSNVQGQRTVGISEKPELVPLDKLKELFDFDPPTQTGHTTVEACQGIIDGSVQAFIGLGGNFARAAPDLDRVEPAWRNLDLTVHIATKLNRTHLLPGKAAYLLPCLARSERDDRAGGRQTVTMEDSFSHIHGSIGKRTPASRQLRSELAIVSGLAKATLPAHPKWRWDEWSGDYGLVRDLIAQTYPEEFHDMSARMFQPGGFYRGNAARERVWKTASGRAEFTVPSALTALGVGDAPGRFHLITMRSNDQFNTTIYGHDDRLRGLSGSRMVLLINRADMARAGLAEGDVVTLAGDAEDGERRAVAGLTVTAFDLPDGCVGGYYPETNPLVPLWYHDEQSKTPASKGVPVRIERG